MVLLHPTWCERSVASLRSASVLNRGTAALSGCVCMCSASYFIKSQRILTSEMCPPQGFQLRTCGPAASRWNPFVHCRGWVGGGSGTFLRGSISPLKILPWLPINLVSGSMLLAWCFAPWGEPHLSPSTSQYPPLDPSVPHSLASGHSTWLVPLLATLFP